MCADAARPVVLAAMLGGRQPFGSVLVVVPTPDAAADFARDLALCVGADRVESFSGFDRFAWETGLPDPREAGARARALWRLGGGGSAPRPLFVVTSVRALLRRIQPPRSGSFEPLRLAEGLELPPGEAARRLVALGYERLGRVESPGQFAIRGGILDVYPGTETLPVRAEYLGDEIESLRRFVSSSQQSIGPAPETLAFACLDLPVDPDTGLAQLPPRVATLLDALPDDGLTVLVEPKSLFDDAARTFDEIRASAPGEWKSPGKVKGYVAPADLPLAARRAMTFFTLADDGLVAATRVDSGRQEPMFGRVERLVERLRADIEADRVPVLAMRDEGQVKRLAEVLAESDLPVASPADGPRRGAVWLTASDLTRGWTMEDPALSVYSHAEIFPSSRRARGYAGTPDSPVAAPIEFSAGDYVVHRTHGIARYAGMTRQTVAGSERDYLLLEYAAGDKLYVPVDQVDRVTRYIGGEAATPKLTRLSTGDWGRATSRARASAKDLAIDLAKIYAERNSVAGWAFCPDNEWARELAAGFPFAETPDQAKAIEAVREDMEKPRPMDRLVCGDVGYGKTEVAIRAAFKAVQDGKQVIVLAPTTILAEQHYLVFKERYAPFPVTVDVLSRFKSESEQTGVVERFNRGLVDVLIGTHRLLSDDVRPRDLGLVVIDEEQRFGVGHKEHFTDMRRAVDVLTLSATPIPRTLQMSLSGVRDLSLIETAPEDRLPVETSVGRYSPETVAAAIRRELARDGQVYYVHNRVGDIDEAGRRLAVMVPEARIAVAHGQMAEHALAREMHRFLSGEVDVLVSTTIIENGLDIPTANTLIVERAERLGLAQLYQLRGRVGRSSARAYAYFFYGGAELLTSAAAERLKTIRDFTQLGSGVKIALRDLEIRGAGNMLGPEQSGQMTAVGFELYVQMLREEVGELTGRPVAPPPEVRIDLPVDAFIPIDYIPDEAARIEAYQDLAGAADTERLAAIRARLADRYGGPLPGPVDNLVEVLRLRHLAAEIGLLEMVYRGGQITLSPVTLTSRQVASLALGRRGLRYVESAEKLAARISAETVGTTLPAEELLRALERLLSDILDAVVQA